MKARLISVQCVHLTASFWYKTNLWWNERKLKMRVKTSGAKCIIYNNPHCYSLWTANLLVSKERGTFCSKAEENRSWHFKRASFSFEFKFNTWGRKAYNSLSSRLPRGKQWTSIVLPDRDHSHFHHCLLHHQESGQHPDSFRMCSDTSPDNIFETGILFVGVSFYSSLQLLRDPG